MAEILLVITYRLTHSPEVFRTPLIRHVFQPRGGNEAQKITYLHPGGIISYAILRPPSNRVLDGVNHTTSLPVLLSLHGAGVETDSEAVRHSFDEAPDLRAWLLFPSGVTSWSGDDWRKYLFTSLASSHGS